VDGPGCALPQYLLHSLRAERHLERKERELPRAFAWASVHAVGVLRGGSREQKRSAQSAYHKVPGYSPGEIALRIWEAVCWTKCRDSVSVCLSPFQS